MKYHVKLTWVKSADPNVKSQHLKVTSGDVVVTDSDLTPDVELFEFDADQNAVLHAELTVSDGVLTSTPVVADATVPAFPTSPVPPSDLKFDFEFVNG